MTENPVQHSNIIVLHEAVAAPLPTTLHLFDFKGRTLPAEQEKLIQTTQFMREAQVIRVAFNRYYDEIEARLDRLDEAYDELQSERSSLRNSLTCSAAYLHLRRELAGLGATDVEAHDFFKMCVDRYVREMKVGFDYANKTNNKVTSDNSRTLKRARDIMTEDGGEPPSWFKENRRDYWKVFVPRHATLFTYLGEHNARIIPGIEDNAMQLGVLDGEEDFPDWFIDESSGIPQLEVVEAEYQEDEAEIIDVTRRMDQVLREEKIMLDLRDQKGLKTVAHYERRRREVTPELNQLSDFLHFVKAAGEGVISMDLKNIVSSTVQEVERSILKPEKVPERMLQLFGESRAVIGQETIALWIEQKLKEGGIINSSQDSISPSVSELLSPLFANDGESGIRENMMKIKETSKKTGSVLMYEIAPLTNLLSDDQRLYLADILAEYQGQPIESLIWEMAEHISSQIAVNDATEFPRQTNITIGHVRNFATRWLGNNYLWASNRLVESLFGTKQQTVEAAQAPLSEGVTETVRETYVETEEVRGGHLGGWKLRYTLKKLHEDTKIVEIEGLTMKEREEAFRQFITRNSIPCSIKPESVIRALEWVTTTPQTVEQMRIRQNIEGEVFKKLKRGRVRIFYDMDPESKSITFFIYQKKAWSYRF